MNVMAQAHKATKANIAARIAHPGSPKYAQLFAYYLAMAHAERKASHTVEAQEVKAGDSYFTLWGDKCKVERVFTFDRDSICIVLLDHPSCIHHKTELVTVARNQAQAVMAETIKRNPFIAAQSGSLVIQGTMAEGGAIWTTAQAMHKDCLWHDEADCIAFADGSSIKFDRNPNSMFSTTYQAA